MSKFYCSFGQDHRHVIDGIFYDKDVILEIEAENQEQAHVLMFQHFNSKWSMCYSLRPADRQLAFFPRGIIPFPPNGEEVLVDLGWANSWGETPKMLENCIKLGHRRTDVDLGSPNRGLNHEVKCGICKFIYHYDSSD